MRRINSTNFFKGVTLTSLTMASYSTYHSILAIRHKDNLDKERLFSYSKSLSRLLVISI